MSVAVAKMYIVHLFNVGDVGGSFKMTGNDFRLISKCPTKFRNIWEFVTRSELESFALGYAEFIEGEDVCEQWCALEFPVDSAN